MDGRPCVRMCLDDETLTRGFSTVSSIQLVPPTIIISFAVHFFNAPNLTDAPPPSPSNCTSGGTLVSKCNGNHDFPLQILALRKLNDDGHV